MNGNQVVDRRVRERMARYAAEEQAEHDAKIAPILAEQQEILRKLAKEHKVLANRFWSRPLTVIAPELYTEAAKDDGFYVQTIRETFTIDDLKAAAMTWLDGLAARSGHGLTEQGAIRLVKFGTSQAKFGKDMSNVEAWQAAFERLQECECFADGEVIYDASLIVAPTPVPPAGPTLDDIEKLDLESREGLKRAKAIVNDLASSEYAPLFSEWLDSLRNNFGFVPTDGQCRTVVSLFQKNNWSFGDRRNYDKARKQMVAQFEFPESCLTKSDLLEREVEAMDTARMSFSERQRLSRRLVHTQNPEAV